MNKTHHRTFSRLLSSALLTTILIITPFSGLAENSDSTSSSTSSSTIFTDIPADHPQAEALEYLKDHYIIKGYSDGSFQPNREINRAEALKIILLSANYHLTEQLLDEAATLDVTITYPDVPLDAWYFSYIQKATELEIVAGYPDGTFHPENTVNLAETLKMIIQANDVEPPIEFEGHPFLDVPLDAWFISYAQFFKDYYLIEADTDGNLHAEKELTRGDLAELIYRFIKREEFQAQGLADADAARYIYTYATFYGGGDGFNGLTTANGEVFDDTQFTAAHRELPFNTWIRVIFTDDLTKEVTVRINDRGPYHPKATIDLAASAFEELQPISRGIIPVKYEIVEEP